MRNVFTVQLGRMLSEPSERTSQGGRRESRAATLARLLIAVATASACGGKSNEGLPASAGGALGQSSSSSGGAAGTSPSLDSTGGKAAGGAAASAGGSLSGTSSSGGSLTASGGSLTASGGSLTASGGSLTASGGSLTALGGAGGADGAPDRMAQLSATPAWAKLRSLWSSLDQVLPKAGTSPAYASAITVEQRQDWLQELESTFGTLEATSLLTELDLLFLRELITARIEVMRDGGYHYELYLHRAPTVFEAGTEASLERIETKIDVLEALRASCSIDADAYGQALEQVEREATVFFVMDQLMLETFAYGNNVRVTLPKDTWGEELISNMDAQLSDLALDPKTNETQMKAIVAARARLATLESSTLALTTLVSELERCDD